MVLYIFPGKYFESTTPACAQMSNYPAGLSTHASKASASVTAVQSEFDSLRALSVIRAKNGDKVPLVSVFQVQLLSAP